MKHIFYFTYFSSLLSLFPKVSEDRTFYLLCFVLLNFVVIAIVVQCCVTDV